MDSLQNSTFKKITETNNFQIFKIIETEGGPPSSSTKPVSL